MATPTPGLHRTRPPIGTDAETPLDFALGYRYLMGLKLQRVQDEGWKVEPTLADVLDERLWEHVEFVACHFVTPAHWRAICNSSPQTFWAALHDWSDFAWPTAGPALPALQAEHVASDAALAGYCEALRETIAQWLHGGTSPRSAYSRFAVLGSIPGASGTALWDTLRYRCGAIDDLSQALAALHSFSERLRLESTFVGRTATTSHFLRVAIRMTAMKVNLAEACKIDLRVAYALHDAESSSRRLAAGAVAAAVGGAGAGSAAATAPAAAAAVGADVPSSFTLKSTHTLHSPWSHGSVELAVTYTSEAAVVDAWVAARLDKGSPFGFDSEHRPVTEKGKSPQLAVLQLSHGNDVLVIQLNAAPGGPAALAAACPHLAQLLVGKDRDGDPELRERIGGMAVREDYRRVIAACGLKAVQEPRLIDVKEFARTAGFDVKGGLDALAVALRIVSKPWKDDAVKMSAWDRFPLTAAQLAYAATDAWASSSICECVMEMTNDW